MLLLKTTQRWQEEIITWGGGKKEIWNINIHLERVLEESLERCALHQYTSAQRIFALWEEHAQEILANRSLPSPYSPPPPFLKILIYYKNVTLCLSLMNQKTF